MKHLITLLFTSLILTSCIKKPDNTNIPKADNINKRQPNFNNLDGDWVETSYIKDLAKTKSALKSQNSLRSIVELNVDTNNIKGDSLEVGSPSVHEGTSFMVYNRAGTTLNSFPTNKIDYDNSDNFYELQYAIINQEPVLTINHYSKAKKILKQIEFKKVAKSSEDPLQYMVNKTLITGVYNTHDVVGTSTAIQFTNDGRVSGLPGYNKYNILTDFVAPGPDDDSSDGICFSINSDKQDCFLYEIKSDTLFLSRGQLKYKLIRQ